MTAPGAPNSPKASERASGVPAKVIALQAVVVGVACLLGTMWLSWPMPAHMNSMLWGRGGDVVGALTTYRELAQHAFPFVPGRIDSLQAPEGLRVDYAFFVATWPVTLLMYLGSVAFGAVVAMNLLVLGAFVVTGVSTFLLVRWLTDSATAGAIAGAALAFQSGQIFNAVSAPDFAHLWVLALLVWRMFVLRDRPTRANGLWAGAATVVAASWNPYYLLIGPVVFSALAVGNLTTAWRRGQLREQIGGLMWSLLPLAAAATLYAVVISSAGRAGVRKHPLSEIYLYSARPGEYLDPPNDDWLLGWLHVPWTRAGVTTHFYLGLTLVVLAGVGVAAAIWSRSARARRADALSLTLVGITAIVWSGPPTAAVGSLNVRLPAWFVGQLTTTWRIYGRFGIVVTFATCVLAGLGIAWLTQRGPLVLRWAVIAGIALLVFVDLRSPAGANYATISLTEPPIYAELRAQPAGAVAEYPILPHDFGAYDQLYRQDFHHRRLLNGYAENSPAEARALTLTRLDDATALRLAQLGIRYVMLDTALPPDSALPAPGTPTARYRLISDKGGWRLYEIRGAPATPGSR
jgi:hypothetical protein